MRRSLLALSSLLLLLCADAHADKVMPPPEDCPVGSEGESSHAGPYCRPLDCGSDTDCEGGRVCREQPLCMKTRAYRERHDNQEHTRQEVTGVCGEGGACLDPSSCQAGKRCVAAAAAPSPATPPPASRPQPAPAPQVPPKASGCAVEGGVGAPVLPLVLVALVVLALQRRARRR